MTLDDLSDLKKVDYLQAEVDGLLRVLQEQDKSWPWQDRAWVHVVRVRELLKPTHVPVIDVPYTNRSV